MNVPTITMPKEEALRAYRVYRQACRGNPTEQDTAVMLGLKAFSKGHAILDLCDVIRAAGLDELRRPRLAIARASWAFCYLYVLGTREGVRFQREPGWLVGRRRIGRRPSLGYVELPPSAFPQLPNDPTASNFTLRAAVPYVPPSIRPAALADYFILWEAVWEPRPPADPLLLRHLHGFLYAVLAVWDLTDLERAVMAQSLGDRGRRP